LADSNVAISYARFSSVRQAQGDSLRRQVEAIDAYIQRHNLVLDTTLSATDLGVSAFDRSNVKAGGLGVFLKAVEAGKVPAGATLVIESLDRLSRAQVLDALEVFIAILNAGLKIATTLDDQLYSRESVGNNFGQLMVSIGIMQRAHDESRHKSERVTRAWANKKVRALAAGTIMTKKVPHWIAVADDRSAFKLVPERVKVVKKMIKWAEAGIGNATIIKKLHAEEVPAWSASGKWEPSYVQKVLTSPALYGGIDIDGEIKEGYYPAIIDREKFVYLQSLRSARATTKATNRGGKVVTNLFSGLLKCGYCGHSMTITGYKSRVSGYERKYVGCHGARTGASDCKMRVWFLDQLEPKLLFWLTSLDVAKLMGTGIKSQLEAEQSQLALLREQQADAARRVANVIAAIEEGMVKRLGELEAEQARIGKLLSAQELKVAAEAAKERGGATRLEALVKLFKALNRTTDEVELRALREQLSAAIASVVEMIALYPMGPTVDGSREDRHAVVLLKNGKTLTIESAG